MKNIRVSFYHDPGHGWYRISIKDLRALGIADQISACSAVHGASVYLEEDDDASLLGSALKDRGIIAKVHRCKQESRSRVRSYRSYRSSVVKL